MKTSMKVTLSAIILSACIVSGVIYIADYSPSLQLKAGDNALNVPLSDSYKYIVRDFEGKIAIYLKGSEKPDMIFDTYTKYLPEYDRNALKSGVYVKTYEELIQLIEDYIS